MRHVFVRTQMKQLVTKLSIAFLFIGDHRTLEMFISAFDRLAKVNPLMEKENKSVIWIGLKGFIWWIKKIYEGESLLLPLKLLLNKDAYECMLTSLWLRAKLVFFYEWIIKVGHRVRLDLESSCWIVQIRQHSHVNVLALFRWIISRQ